MELLDLNDDVLPLVFAYLHGKSALNASLTCKHIFELAIHRVVAVVRCHSFEQLHLLNRYLSSTPSRARHVEDLTIRYQTFYGVYAIHGVTRPTTKRNLEETRLIVSILDKTRNLRRLSLFHLHSLSQISPPILLSIWSLRHLRSFEAEEISISTMTMFNTAAFADLHTLWLQFCDEAMPLVTLLSHLRKLVTLTLCEYIGASEEVTEQHLLPSIEHLRLVSVSPHALKITELCPNLSTLVFFLNHKYTLGNVFPLPGKRLGPLQSLCVGGDIEFKCIERLLPATAHHLHFTETFSINVNNSRADTSAIGIALYRTSPIAVTLSVTPGLAQVSLWPAVANAAPRLRVLTVYAFPDHNYSLFERWVVRP